MKISKQELNDAVDKNIINQEQAHNLWNFWSSQDEGIGLNFATALYFLGAFLTIFAASSYIWTKGISQELFLPLISSLFITSLIMAEYFKYKNLKTPAGIMAFIAAIITPLLAYLVFDRFDLWTNNAPTKLNFLHSFNDFPNFNNDLLKIKFITLFVSIILFLRHKTSFLLMPVILTSWITISSLKPIYTFFHNIKADDVTKTISLIFGLLSIFIGLFLNIKSKQKYKKYSFWFYNLGAIIFFVSVFSLLWSKANQLYNFIFMLISLILIIKGIFLKQIIISLLGFLGFYYYISYLLNKYSQNALSFTIYMIIAGFSLILFGVYWKKNGKNIRGKLIGILPTSLQNLIQKIEES